MGNCRPGGCWIERSSGLAVRVCYGVTFAYVACLLVNGLRQGVSQQDQELQARDKYATSPGFDPIEQQRSMRKATEFFAEHPEKM